MSKEKDFLFSLGDTQNGAVGFCATVRGKNAKTATQKLKKALEWFNRECDVAKATGIREEVKDLRDLEVYFNPDYINEDDIIEVNPAEEVA